MINSLDLYKSARRIRTIEQALIDEYHPADEMRCPIHFCVGQEITPAALGLCLKPKDAIFSHYRSHGYYLAKGLPLDSMVAEFYGKASGANGGAAGSMELAGENFHSGAIVGGLAGLAVGNAFAQKYRGESAITVSVFGDGAMDEGATYEAINLAVIYSLPVLFICENNGYAAHTSLEARTKGNITDRAEALGICAESWDDFEPEVLAREINRLVKTVRKNRVPVFLEVGTYRTCGHVGAHDDSDLGYRSPEEIADRLEFDPLEYLRQRVGVGSACEVGFKEEIAQAIAAAKSAPMAHKPIFSLSNTSSNLNLPIISGLASEFSSGQTESIPGPF